MAITFLSSFLNTSPFSMVLLRRIRTTNLDCRRRCVFCKLVNFQNPGRVPYLHNEPVVSCDSIYSSESQSLYFPWDLAWCLEWLFPSNYSRNQLCSEAKSIHVSRADPGKKPFKYFKVRGQRDFLDELSYEDPCELILQVSFVHIFCSIPCARAYQRSQKESYKVSSLKELTVLLGT